MRLAWTHSVKLRGEVAFISCRLGSIASPDHDLGRPEQRLINHRVLSPIKAYRVESRRHKILQLPGLARCNNKIFR